MRCKRNFLIFLLIVSCTTKEEPENVLSFVFATQSSDGCISTGNGDKNLPLDTDIVVKVSGASLTEPIVKRFKSKDLNSQGEIVITGIPEGDNYKLNVIGCDSTNSATWSAETTDISVKKHTKTSPYIFLTKKGVLSCTGSEYLINDKPIGNSKITIPRAFHSAVLLSKDAVVISGGANINENDIFSASSAVDVYFVDTGDFKEILKQGETDNKSILVEKRAFHYATALSDDEVLITGGVRSFKLSQLPDKPPITIVDQDSIIKQYGLEIFSLSQGGSTGIALNFIPTPFSTITEFIGNEKVYLIFSGGIDENWKPQERVIQVSGTIGDFRTGNIQVKQGHMSVPRVGHSISKLKNGNLFIFGGIYGNYGEIIKKDSLESVTVKFDFSNFYYPAFHSAISLGTSNTDEILVIGGNQISSKVNFVVASNPQVMILSVTEDEKGYSVKERKIDLGDTSEYFLRSYFNAALLTDSTLVINGGYRSFKEETIPSECSGKDFCFPESILFFTINQQTGTDNLIINKKHELKFSTSRLGVSSLVLPDGTILFSGGITSLNEVTDNSEIYNPLPTDEESELCKSNDI